MESTYRVVCCSGNDLWLRAARTEPDLARLVGEARELDEEPSAIYDDGGHKIWPPPPIVER